MRNVREKSIASARAEKSEKQGGQHTKSCGCTEHWTLLPRTGAFEIETPPSPKDVG